MLAGLENSIGAVLNEPWAKEFPKDQEFWSHFIAWVEEDLISKFLDRLSRKVDEIVEIDPDLSEKEILEKAASPSTMGISKTKPAINNM